MTQKFDVNEYYESQFSYVELDVVAETAPSTEVDDISLLNPKLMVRK